MGGRKRERSIICCFSDTPTRNEPETQACAPTRIDRETFCFVGHPTNWATLVRANALSSDFSLPTTEAKSESHIAISCHLKKILFDLEILETGHLFCGMSLIWGLPDVSSWSHLGKRYFIFILILTQGYVLLIQERGKRGEGKKERKGEREGETLMWEKNELVASHMPSNWSLNLQP